MEDVNFLGKGLSNVDHQVFIELEFLGQHVHSMAELYGVTVHKLT